jgi:hypothetical protein
VVDRAFATLLLLLGFACSGPPTSLEHEFEGARARLHRTMWGSEPEPEAVDQDRRTLRCVWDALREADADAEAEIRCFVTRTEAFVECRGDAAECVARSERACLASAAFEAAARACSTPR